jgi:hypothetical protein
MSGLGRPRGRSPRSEPDHREPTGEDCPMRCARGAWTLTSAPPAPPHRGTNTTPGDGARPARPGERASGGLPRRTSPSVRRDVSRPPDVTGFRGTPLPQPRPRDLPTPSKIWFASGPWPSRTSRCSRPKLWATRSRMTPRASSTSMAATTPSVARSSRRSSPCAVAEAVTRGPVTIISAGGAETAAGHGEGPQGPESC